MCAIPLVGCHPTVVVEPFALQFHVEEAGRFELESIGLELTCENRRLPIETTLVEHASVSAPLLVEKQADATGTQVSVQLLQPAQVSLNGWCVSSPLRDCTCTAEFQVHIVDRMSGDPAAGSPRRTEFVWPVGPPGSQEFVGKLDGMELRPAWGPSRVASEPTIQPGEFALFANAFDKDGTLFERGCGTLVTRVSAEEQARLEPTQHYATYEPSPSRPAGCPW